MSNNIFVTIDTDKVASRLFHAVVRKDAVPPTYSDDEYEGTYEYDVESARRFFARLGDALDVDGKSILDIGCGGGLVCVAAAQRGATHAVGVDMQPLGLPRAKLADRFPALDGVVTLIDTDGSLREVGDRQFDVLISKDSFEHYDDPEGFITTMDRFLAPGGQFVIGFGPLWKGPTGGHIDFMTKVPWAHLIFPERVIMAERRRFRPAENADRFAEVRGGLNKMTLQRFETIMTSSGLRRRHFATNVSDSPMVKAMGLVSRVPPLREYFTANVYGIWEKSPA
jgi:SAM-dependent methyltransferase